MYATFVQRSCCWSHSALIILVTWPESHRVELDQITHHNGCTSKHVGLSLKICSSTRASCSRSQFPCKGMRKHETWSGFGTHRHSSLGENITERGITQFVIHLPPCTTLANHETTTSHQEDISFAQWPFRFDFWMQSWTDYVRLRAWQSELDLEVTIRCAGYVT